MRGASAVAGGVVVASLIGGVAGFVTNGVTARAAGSVPRGARVIAVYKPSRPASAGTIKETERVIERRLKGLGVTGSMLYTKATEVVVDLPYAKDDTQVLKLVGQRAQVYFRPVDCVVAPFTGPTTTVGTVIATKLCELGATRQAQYPSTPPFRDLGHSTVVLPFYARHARYRYVLGPAEMSGSIIKAATAALDPFTKEWAIDVTMTPSGSALFNKYAVHHYLCYERRPQDPPYCAEQALELDGVVETAPNLEAAAYHGAAQISGSSSAPFTQQQAKDMALLLNYGELPIRLVAAQIETVTPAR